MYLTIVSVIIEIIMKMIVMLMNKDDNNNISKKTKNKETMNQSISASPSILNEKRPNTYAHELTHHLE